MGSWDIRDLRTSSEGYKLLAVLLCDDLRYAKVLMDVIKSEEVDDVANAIVHISDVVGRSLPLIQMMTQAEFERNSSVSTIFRLHSLASRTMGTYVRQIGQGYLGLVLGDLLERLMEAELAISLEIDPTKITPDLIAPGSTLDAVLERNRQVLTDITQRVFDRITMPAMVEIMPRGIRAACNFISSVCEQYQDKFTVDDKTKLVGGFVMLRFFNPALLTPEANQLLPPGQSPSPVSRRNLILITKTLQNLSNNVQFGQKEQFMVVMNPFLKRNAIKMRNYLESLPIDPLQRQGRTAWGDLDAQLHTRLELPSNLRKFNLTRFLTLHRVTLKNRDRLKKDIQEMPPFPGQTNSDIQISHVISHLGEEPRFKIVKSMSDQQAQMLGKTVLVSFDMRIGRIHTTALIKPGAPGLKEWDALYFFYAGPPSRKGIPVVYFVLRRFNFEDLRFITSLREYVKYVCAQAVKLAKPAASSGPRAPRKSMSDLISGSNGDRTSGVGGGAENGAADADDMLGPDVDGASGEMIEFDVVLDLSFSGLPDDLLRSFLSQLRQFLDVLPRSLTLHTLYVINPTRLYYLTMFSLGPSFPADFSSKVEEMYSQKFLRNHLAENLIPEESRYFFPNCFFVDLVTKKGLSPRPRAVKVTSRSVLEIDTRTNTLKGEYMLASLDELLTDATRIELIFTNPATTLVLEMSSQEQHSSLVNAVLQACVELANSSNSQTSYTVTKINRSGKKQTRILMAFQDCLMNVKRDVIKGVIPFLSLGRVSQSAPCRVKLEFEGVFDRQHRGERELIFKDNAQASAFVDQATEAIKEAQLAIKNDKESQMKTLTLKGLLRAVLVVKVIWLGRARARIRERNRIKDLETARMRTVNKISGDLRNHPMCSSDSSLMVDSSAAARRTRISPSGSELRVRPKENVFSYQAVAGDSDSASDSDSDSDSDNKKKKVSDDY
eukprot:c9545_g1_i1.p1 GENE.c9545_g1_i1~~c9545_g1_i1.p1  ORF type:complete len:947 (+),score=211.06 c9545_g1_i1:256-3096(+)